MIGKGMKTPSPDFRISKQPLSLKNNLSNNKIFSAPFINKKNVVNSCLHLSVIFTIK